MRWHVDAGASMSIKIVVPVSGGKDSQACLKMAVSEVGADHVMGLFCDTQFEHPLTYKHIGTLSELYNVRIKVVTAGSVDEKVLREGNFPGGKARFCTNELKIIPSKNFYRELAKQQGGFIVYYGMRLDESNDRAERYKSNTHDEVYDPHEIMPSNYPKYLAKMGVFFKMPILEWSVQQVMDYIGADRNPLYDQGMTRVGCFPCLAAGDRAKEQSFGHDDFGRSQRIRVKNLEDQIGRSVFNSAGGMQRNNPDQIGLFDNPGCGVCNI
jgi:3'-phosphoadenosine 5'-phosphosulfate sulfotransferase (PAPS reductase)/FAD synthetase